MPLSKPMGLMSCFNCGRVTTDYEMQFKINDGRCPKCDGRHFREHNGKLRNIPILSWPRIFRDCWKWINHWEYDNA